MCTNGGQASIAFEISRAGEKKLVICIQKVPASIPGPYTGHPNGFCVHPQSRKRQGIFKTGH